MTDQILDDIKVSHRAQLLQRFIEIAADCLPDNMGLFQLKRAVDYALTTEIADIDVKHLYAMILTVGYAHLPAGEVGAAIVEDRKNSDLTD